MDEVELINVFCLRLKSLRLSKDLTLDELSRLSGVSIATISKIENQQQKPGFETILKISRALHINFVHMLEPEPTVAPKMARRVVTRAAEAPVYESGIYGYAVHATDLAQKAMVPLVMHVETAVVPPVEEWSVHDGEEFAYVLEGAITLHTEHYAPTVLQKGDSCYFDSTMRHAYVCRDASEATLLSVCLSIIPFEPT
jgi:transcriptional regulator with XRE-family HTH domain